MHAHVHNPGSEFYDLVPQRLLFLYTLLFWDYCELFDFPGILIDEYYSLFIKSTAISAA